MTRTMLQPYHWLHDGETLWIQPELTIRKIPGYHEEWNYECTGNCTEGTCSTEACTGDRTYLKAWPTNGRTLMDCDCRFLQHTPMFTAEIYHDKKFSEAQCWGSVSAVVSVKDPVMLKRSINAAQKDPACKSCVAICTGGSLHFKSTAATIVAVKFCKDPDCVTEAPNARDFTLALKSQMLVQEGRGDLIVWTEGADEPAYMSVECTNLDICISITCIMCRERMLMPACWSWVDWVIITLVLVSFIALLSVVGFVLTYASATMYYMFWPMRKLLSGMRWLFGNSMAPVMHRLRNRRLRMKPVQEVELESLNDEELESYDKIARARLARLRANGLLCIMIVYCLLTCAQACSHSVEMVASSEECDTDAGVTICHISSSVNLAVAPIGQESCLILKDEKGKVLGKFSIITKDLKAKCVPNIHYYVSDYAVNCVSAFNCDGSWECSEQTCKTFSKDKVLDEWTGASTNLGLSTCDWINTPVGDFCWWGWGCIWGRTFAYSTTSYKYTVGGCDSYVLALESTLSIAISNTPPMIKDMELTLEDSISLSDVEVTLTQGQISGNLASGKCFMISDNQAGMIDCAAKSSPVKGLVGEIQCPSEEEAIHPSPNCVMADDLFTEVPDGDSMHCSAHLTQPQKALADGKLPLQHGGAMFVFDGRDIYAQSSSGASATVNMKFKNMKVITKEDRGKCTMNFDSLKGCFSCDAGSLLKVKGSSTVDYEVFQVSCPSAFTPASATSRLSESLIPVKLHFKTAIVDEDCEIVCGDSKFSIHVKATLDWVPPSDHKTSSGNDTSSPHHPWGDFDLDIWHWLTSLLPAVFWANLMKIGLFAAIGLCVFILVLFLVENGLMTWGFKWLIRRKVKAI
jgi:hypothetical protein